VFTGRKTARKAFICFFLSAALMRNWNARFLREWDQEKLHTYESLRDLSECYPFCFPGRHESDSINSVYICLDDDLCVVWSPLHGRHVDIPLEQACELAQDYLKKYDFEHIDVRVDKCRIRDGDRIIYNVFNVFASSKTRSVDLVARLLNSTFTFTLKTSQVLVLPKLHLEGGDLRLDPESRVSINTMMMVDEVEILKPLNCPINMCIIGDIIISKSMVEMFPRCDKFILFFSNKHLFFNSSDVLNKNALRKLLESLKDNVKRRKVTISLMCIFPGTYGDNFRSELTNILNNDRNNDFPGVHMMT